MFCENCGAKNGETDEQNWHRMGFAPTSVPFDDITFVVSSTAWGYVCQYCREHPSKKRHYTRNTGEARVQRVS